MTWKSIAIARHINPDATLRDCVIDAPEISYDQELIDVLGVLQSVGFVFVRNERGEINGIVTAADLAHAYGDMATPFFLIGELDQLLRHIVSKHIDLADVITLCDTAGARGITSFDQLTMGDYERTLQNPDAWAQIGTKLDRASFCARLGMIREIRNDIMHFNPEDIPPTAVDMLRNFLRMIRLNVPGCQLGAYWRASGSGGPRTRDRHLDLRQAVGRRPLSRSRSPTACSSAGPSTPATPPAPTDLRFFRFAVTMNVLVQPSPAGGRQL